MKYAIVPIALTALGSVSFALQHEYTAAAIYLAGAGLALTALAIAARFDR